MSVGASSIITIVGSVLSQEENKHGTVDLRLPKAPTKGKFPCYYALLIIEGVGMWLADHSCLQDIVLISPIFRVMDKKISDRTKTRYSKDANTPVSQDCFISGCGKLSSSPLKQVAFFLLRRVT